MNKIIIPRDEKWIFLWACVPILIILVTTCIFSWYGQLKKTESQLLLIFRVFNILSITSVSYINVLIYFPFDSFRLADLGEGIIKKIKALRFFTLALALIFCSFALSNIDKPFIFSFFVAATFSIFYIYDISVISFIKNKASDGCRNLNIAMRASLTGYTRPMLRTYVIIFGIITIFFLITQKYSSGDSALMIETFIAGMVTFNLISTTLVFIEQNCSAWRGNE